MSREDHTPEGVNSFYASWPYRRRWQKELVEFGSVFFLKEVSFEGNSLSEMNISLFFLR